MKGWKSSECGCGPASLVACLPKRGYDGGAAKAKAQG